MKKAKSDRTLVRESSMVIAVTEQEKFAVKHAAENIGITMSSFVRMVLKEYLKKETN